MAAVQYRCQTNHIRRAGGLQGCCERCRQLQCRQLHWSRLCGGAAGRAPGSAIAWAGARSPVCVPSVVCGHSMCGGVVRALQRPEGPVWFLRQSRLEKRSGVRGCSTSQNAAMQHAPAILLFPRPDLYLDQLRRRCLFFQDAVPYSVCMSYSVRPPSLQVFLAAGRAASGCRTASPDVSGDRRGPQWPRASASVSCGPQSRRPRARRSTPRRGVSPCRTGDPCLQLCLFYLCDSRVWLHAWPVRWGSRVCECW
jgi:hypothetical protein